jgi:hypothetical protein
MCVCSYVFLKEGRKEGKRERSEEVSIGDVLR